MLVDVLARKIQEGDVPPHLRMGNALERCGGCKHYESGAGECLRYGFPVRATEVCDSFERRRGGTGV